MKLFSLKLLAFGLLLPGVVHGARSCGSDILKARERLKIDLGVRQFIFSSHQNFLTVRDQQLDYQIFFAADYENDEAPKGQHTFVVIFRHPEQPAKCYVKGISTAKLGWTMGAILSSTGPVLLSDVEFDRIRTDPWYVRPLFLETLPKPTAGEELKLKWDSKNSR